MEIEQLVDKINNGTATLQDAMEFAAENAVGSTRQKNVPSLLKFLKKQEEAGNLPFSLSDPFNPKRVPKEIVDYLSKNPNLVYRFQNYEDTIEPALKDEGFSYSKGVGKESASGLTQRGPPGQKESAKLPMRGLITARRQDDLYEAAFGDIDNIADSSDDPLASKKATKMKEAFLFHRLTGSRVERVFPKSKSDLGSAITLGDFSEYTDEATGKTSLILTGGAANKKSYFSFEYTDEMKDFVNSIRTKRLQELAEAGIDAEEAKKYPLFDITKGEAGETWNATFRKRINSPDFKDIAASVPKSKDTTLDTIGLVRSMVPRSLRQENKVPSSVAEEFQGHVEKGMGAGSYTGDVPRSDAGTLSNYILRDSAFRSEDKTVNSLFDRLGLRSTDYFGNKKYTSTGFYRTTETVPKIAVEEITPEDTKISDSIAEQRDVNRAKSVAETKSELLDIQTKTAQQTIEAEPTLIEGAKSEARIEAAKRDAASELAAGKKAAEKSAEFEAKRKKFNKILGRIGRGTKNVGAIIAGTGVGAPIGASVYAGGTALTLNEASDLNDDAESLRQQARSILNNPASTIREKASAHAMIAEADRLSGQAIQTVTLPVTEEDVRTVGGVIKGAVEPALKSGIQPGFGMFGVPRVIPEEERSNIDNQLNNLMREPLRQELE